MTTDRERRSIHLCNKARKNASRLWLHRKLTAKRWRRLRYWQRVTRKHAPAIMHKLKRFGLLN